MAQNLTLGTFALTAGMLAASNVFQPLKWDYLWAALCILGAVYFIFRG